MKSELDTAVELLNEGIDAKRKGNLNKSIDFYKKAREVYPEYPATYLNFAKVYILQDKFEIAFRNLLINIHLRILQNEEINTPDFIEYNTIVKHDNKKLKINEKAVRELIGESKINEFIAKEINVTFYAGLSYVCSNPKFLKYHKIKKTLIDSEKEVLSGKIPSSENIRQSKFVNLINIIGFKWIIDNLNTDIKDNTCIISYYLDSTNEIVKPDTSVFDPKTTEIHDYSWWQIMDILLLTPFRLIPHFFIGIWENIVVKDKKFHKRLLDIVILPFGFIFAPIVLVPVIIIKKLKGRSKAMTDDLSSKYETDSEIKHSFSIEDIVDEPNTPEDSGEYRELNDSYEGNLLEGDFVVAIKDSEIIKIFNGKEFENIWAKRPNNDKYSLFLSIQIDERLADIGLSEVKEQYYIELIRMQRNEGTYEDGLPNGIYEFEITNDPSLNFDIPSCMKHIGKKVYIERRTFEEHFVIPLYLEDIYDDQLKNTIGLEEIEYN